MATLESSIHNIKELKVKVVIVYLHLYIKSSCHVHIMVKDVRSEYELICSCSQLIPCNFILAAGKTDTIPYLKKGLKIGVNRSLTIRV